MRCIILPQQQSSNKAQSCQQNISCISCILYYIRFKCRFCILLYSVEYFQKELVLWWHYGRDILKHINFALRKSRWMYFGDAKGMTFLIMYFWSISFRLCWMLVEGEILSWGILWFFCNILQLNKVPTWMTIKLLEKAIISPIYLTIWSKLPISIVLHFIRQRKDTLKRFHISNVPFMAAPWVKRVKWTS